MLRSASTPLFGSLLSSFSESPIHGGSPFSDVTQPTNTKVHYRSNLQQSSSTMIISSRSTTPDSNSSSGFRRAQSEGNLESLVTCKKCLKLEPILSFSCHGKDPEDEDSEDEEVTDFYTSAARTIPKGKTLVIDGGGRSGGGDDYSPSQFHGGDSGDGGETDQTDQNYRRMLEKDPSNPLILRNYAEFLHQVKGDLIGAETYCSRAILADPTDGDTLSLYAQLSWRLYRNEDKATDYFDRAAKASPNDSHVHAAYARFLWEIDEEDDSVVPLKTTPSQFQIISA